MIDFSTLQGLTIPEGAVTQITDASGRVLWSAAPAFDGIIYLRPSADISVDSTIALYPSTATSAYSLINEEVSDGSATYIHITSTAETGTADGTARFSVSGNVPKKITKVTNVYLVVSADKSPGVTPEAEARTPTAFLHIYLIIDGVSYEMRSSKSSPVDDGFEGAYYEPLICMPHIVTTADICAVINESISTDENLPNMEIRLDLDTDAVENAGGKRSYGYVKVSQAYIVIECE